MIKNNAPETIYLQWIPGTHILRGAWFRSRSPNVIYEDDIEYTRKDIADKRIAELEFLNKVVDYSDKTSKEKDTKIAELEAEIDIRDKALNDSQVDLEMWRE